MYRNTKVPPIPSPRDRTNEEGFVNKVLPFSVIVENYSY